MTFWIYMLIISLLLPVTMLIVGRVFLARAPKNINMFLGYRTPMSTKNRDTWQFAHRYCGKIWIWGGLASFLVSVIAMLLVLGREIKTVGLVGALTLIPPFAVIIVSIALTEKALKKAFDRYGFRKEELDEQNKT